MDGYSDSTRVKVHYIVWYSSLVLVLVACLVSFIQIRDHLKYNPHPKIRKYLVRIFLLIPIYAIESWLALRLFEYEIVLETARDCYEVFVLFSFFQFLVEYLGGEHRLILALEPKAHIFPICCCPTWRPPQKFLTYSKLGTLQYVFVRVICSIVQLWMMLAGNFDVNNFSWKSVELYLLLLINFSQIWALYCLVIFYLSLQVKLSPIRPIPKFLSIKMVIFFTWWQMVLIGLLENKGWLKTSLAYDGENAGKSIQSVLICIEMVGFAIWFRYAYPVKEFMADNEDSVASQPIFKSLLTAVNVVDVMSEVPVPHREKKGPKAEVSIVAPEPKFEFESIVHSSGAEKLISYEDVVFQPAADHAFVLASSESVRSNPKSRSKSKKKPKQKSRQP